MSLIIKKITTLILTTYVLIGCQFFESDRYYSCSKSQPNDGSKFSITIGVKTVKVGRIEYERCSSKDKSILFSDQCKDLNTGYFGTLDLITGEFYSTEKETSDSKVTNYTKGLCSRIENI